MRCIVCNKKLTMEDAGLISGQIASSATDFKDINYIPPKIFAYHASCENEAIKIIEKEDKIRYKKMGLI